MCVDTFDNALSVWLTLMYKLLNLIVESSFAIYVYTCKAHRGYNFHISVSHTDQKWFIFTKPISSWYQLCLLFKAHVL